jgi:Carboxypeptidase regulatory-like domain
MKFRKTYTWIVSAVLALSITPAAFAQARGSLRGSIADEFGAVIVGATVTLTDSSGARKTTTSGPDGAYAFTGLLPGKYTIHAVAAGFAPSEGSEVQIGPGQRQSQNITLKVGTIESEVKVDSETPLSTDASSNANQTLITGRDLDALPDDPAELAAALQAMAGPSIGPNGGQIFIDGFSSGAMPPKESIREIRINQNPFAAENDQPSSRIDILTRPGSEKYRGSASLNFNDESLNSRNPFQTSSSKRTPFQIRQMGMNFSGPLKRGKSSFFLEANRNETDDNELIRATILDPALNFVTLGQGVLVPRRFTGFSPRVDYAINTNNTLVARYNYNRNVTQNQGVGGFSLAERGYNSFNTNQVFQVTETAVLNSTMINETRFQFNHNHSEQLGDISKPVLNVSGAFVGGGSQVGHATTDTNRWEINNFTAMQRGSHAIKFGGRIRGVSIRDVNPNNFGGQWGFTGGPAPELDPSNNPIPGTLVQLTSIQRYQRTLLLMQAGRTPVQIREAGGGASQFSINTGNPRSSVSQFDIEPYIQDDWRYKPNLTISYGLRYEIQNNAGSKYDFAPRLAVAWSPGAGNSARPPKMVIRAGAGIFYNRFGEQQTLLTRRFNGSNTNLYSTTEPVRQTAPTAAQQADPAVSAVYNFLNSYACANGTITPNCIGIVPTVTGTIPATQQTIWQVIPQIQIPTVYVGGVQIERQLPRNFTMSVGAYALRILHVIRARDINAPLPATITASTPNGIRPDPSKGEIYQFEASGRFNQRQVFVGFNSRLNPQFSLNGNYVLSKTTNDTDGQGGSLFPMNSYDLRGEFGRASFDVRHRFFLFGTYNSKLWKLVFSPFLTASSGVPFNIVTGLDANLDRQANERPSFASPNAPCGGDIKCTALGRFNIRPAPGEQIIPRNYGQGPSSFTLNLRINRTFGFVDKGGARSQANGRTAGNTDRRGGRSGGGVGPSGPMIPGGGGGAGGPGGGGGGQRGPGGGGGGMPGGFGSGGATEKKYTLNVSLYIQNLLNNVNLAPPIGNLSSPQFGLSQSVAGSFGGFGGGGGGSANAGNRRVYINLRLSF